MHPFSIVVTKGSGICWFDARHWHAATEIHDENPTIVAVEKVNTDVSLFIASIVNTESNKKWITHKHVDNVDERKLRQM